MGVPDAELPSDEWLDEVRLLSSRKYACGYIKDMLTELNDERLVGHDMRFCASLMDNGKWKMENDHKQESILHSQLASKAHCPLSTSSHSGDSFSEQSEALIFKSPWSSSGRGVFTSHNLSAEQIEKKLQGFLNTQGGYLMDRFYEKEQDFAMEFSVHADHSVEFLGFSVFHADESGTYGYNLVESQETLKAKIGMDEEQLDKLIAYHKAHLGQTDYYGPVGIDMLRLTNGQIHPCIEINLRMNMGILAILLYNRFGANANVQLTPHREQGFEATITNGHLQITYKS